MKKIIVLLFVGFNIIINNTYASNNNDNIFLIPLSNIMEKQIELHGVYKSYENLLEFNNAINKLNKTKGVKLLLEAVKETSNNHEFTNFINEVDNIIYVPQLEKPFVYYDQIKTDIYEFNNSIIPNGQELQSYKICEINNKKRCSTYNRTIFAQNITNNNYNFEVGNQLNIKDDGLYFNKLKLYYPDTNVFFTNNGFITTYLTKLKKDTIVRYYGNNYLPLNNFGIYKNNNGEQFIGEFTINKVSNFNFKTLKSHSNTNTILDTFQRDLRYTEYIEKNIINELFLRVDMIGNDIGSIYNFVKNELEYDYDVYEQFLKDGTVNKNKEYVFSGIGSYENKTSVCSGYSSLLHLILGYKGYNDVESIDGYHIEVKNGNLIPHTWLRVGDKYYDVTFDDGINGDNKNQDIYFGLPKEIMYLDRVDNDNINEIDKLENMTNQERINYVLNNKLNFVKKYENNTVFSNYLLIKPYFELNKIINFQNINDFSLEQLFNNQKDKYLFSINNGSISFNVILNGENKIISDISLTGVNNFLHLIEILQHGQINKLELGKTNDNKYFLINKITLR